MEERPSASQTMDRQMWLRAPTPEAPGTSHTPAHTHRDQRLKEAVEKQVPQGLALLEVRHKPDEKVGDNGQGRGEDDPEEGEGLSGGRMPKRQDRGPGWTALQPHRVPGRKEIPPPGCTHPRVSGKGLMAQPRRAH